jgi:hypothetical protein
MHLDHPKCSNGVPEGIQKKGKMGIAVGGRADAIAERKSAKNRQ